MQITTSVAQAIYSTKKLHRSIPKKVVWILVQISDHRTSDLKINKLSIILGTKQYRMTLPLGESRNFISIVQIGRTPACQKVTVKALFWFFWNNFWQHLSFCLMLCFGICFATSFIFWYYILVRNFQFRVESIRYSL